MKSGDDIYIGFEGDPPSRDNYYIGPAIFLEHSNPNLWPSGEKHIKVKIPDGQVVYFPTISVVDPTIKH